ncbi:MAG: VanZ family protein [Breznakibacter sp.]
MVHFIMYFTLSLVFMLECYYKSLVQPKKTKLILINLIPLLMSITLELIQEYLTTSRTGSFYDELFNILGILVAILTFYLIKSWKLVKYVITFPIRAS